MSKYRSRKVYYNGVTFDSLKEFERYKELMLLERAGEIKRLERQVPYELIPTQRESSNEVYKKGKKKGEFKPGKVIENSCVYIADFVYEDTKTGNTIVEDCKGVKTKDYIIKRKLMLLVYGIKTKET